MATILKYVSKGGTVRMNGPLSHIALIALSGFELPAAEYEEIEFASENGVTTTGKKDSPRTMTVSGDIQGGQKTIEEILKAFYYDGTLYCEFGNIKRKIDCKVINMSDVDRKGKSGINSFTVQFQADYPYFSDFNDTVKAVSGRRDLINGSFVLPCVWTEYVQGGVIKNTGDKIVFPIIAITAQNATESTSATITVANNTTGAFITLDYVMEEGETITIDLNTRRLKSSLNGYITNKISDDTVLSNFYLELGDNDISFETDALGQSLRTVITYNKLYLMAVR